MKKTRWEKFKKVILNFIGDTEEDTENTLIIKDVNKYEKIEILKFVERMKENKKTNHIESDGFELIFKQK